MFEYQGSRLRLKRSHLRPKILICEWSFCWGRHWRLYIFTCYDIKICMQGLFSWLFCDHIFCFVHVLNLKLKDDTHQSFSGKKFQTVLVSAAQQRWRTQSAKHSSSCAAWDRLKWRRASAEKPCLFRAQLEQTSTGKAVSSVDTGNIVNNSHL